MSTSHRAGTPFADRRQAGLALAKRLGALPGLRGAVVVALPRGGVPVAAEVARALGAPLDLLLVRKIGVPWQPELAVAAVAEGEPAAIVIDDEVQRLTGVDSAWIENQAARELNEIARRRHVYLGDRPRVRVEGRTVIVVDDGLATGTTMRAALKALRRAHPARLVMAVPVAPADTLAALRTEVDDMVCLEQPQPFHSVGQHYIDFRQVEDDEVIASLSSAPSPRLSSEGGAALPEVK